jgi:hypothetical protein
MKTIGCFAIICISTALMFSCSKDETIREKDEFYSPIIRPENFVRNITNPFMPCIPGTVYTYQVETDEGNEINEVTVTSDTILIAGVVCTVVKDIVKNESGDVLENTSDWFAQDEDGNVWYFGEDTKEYENGKVISTIGTWKTGVDGAQPGIIMPGIPVPGVPYRQEYLFNEAEDMGKVISFSETVTVPYGTFSNCLMTEEWSPLEPGVVEHKYYASGIGNIKSISVKGENEISELTAKTGK